MTDNIIHLKPRDQVPRTSRRIPRFRTDPEDFEVKTSTPVTLHGSIGAIQFLEALSAAGFTHRWDVRTQSLFVFPAAGSVTTD